MGVLLQVYIVIGYEAGLVRYTGVLTPLCIYQSSFGPQIGGWHVEKALPQATSFQFTATHYESGEVLIR